MNAFANKAFLENNHQKIYLFDGLTNKNLDYKYHPANSTTLFVLLVTRHYF